MNKAIAAILLFFLSLSTYGQELILKAGKASKVFNKFTYYDFFVSECVEQDQNKCCDCQSLFGTVTAVDADSLTLLLSSYDKKLGDAETGFTEYSFLTDKPVEHRIAKDNIYALKNYRFIKTKKKKGSWKTLGGVLIVTGIATAINALVVPGTKNKGRIMTSAGIQFGVGIGLAVFTRTKKYELKGSGPHWTIE